MATDPRRARARLELLGGGAALTHQGEAEAVIGGEGLTVGPVSVSFLDADSLRAGDYRIELDLWPDGRLTLTQMGRRFDAFTEQLRLTRNQTRVAGLLAHGVAMAEIFHGAILSGSPTPAELQVFETHVVVAPLDGDPWQVPLGSVRAVRVEDDPPAVVLETDAGETVLGHLGRRRDEFHDAVVERLEAQRTLLADLTGQSGFSDGQGIVRSQVRDFDKLIERLAAPDRAICARALLSHATGEPRVGFVRLLDPGGDTLLSAAALPESWASFLLVPRGARTVLEILAGPTAATYVFAEGLESVNRDLQQLHFRRAPLALSAEDALLTTSNPHRLALRRLEPLQRLRGGIVARLIHR